MTNVEGTAPMGAPMTPPVSTRLATALLLALLLAVPGAATLAPPPAAAATAVHVVQRGDTVNGLARRYRLSPLQLVRWNDLRSPYSLHPDGVLRVSRPASAAVRPAFTSSVTGVSAADLGASYRSGCPVAPSSLRLLTVPHTTFDGGWASGRLVVHADVATATTQVFRQLYEQRVPVQRMVPVSAYGGSDDASMAANNTSAFNCRRTTSGTAWSEHSYGRAVDANPVQNPYVSGRTVLPPAGAGFTDRSRYAVGMLHAEGGVRAFAGNGYSWGGAWSSLKDYQHFSTTGR